jgi:hypothetical protein
MGLKKFPSWQGLRITEADAVTRALIRIQGLSFDTGLSIHAVCLSSSIINLPSCFPGDDPIFDSNTPLPCEPVQADQHAQNNLQEANFRTFNNSSERPSCSQPFSPASIEHVGQHPYMFHTGLNLSGHLFFECRPLSFCLNLLVRSHLFQMGVLRIQDQLSRAARRLIWGR